MKKITKDDLANNPIPRLASCLLLDTSISMGKLMKNGLRPIDELNKGVSMYMDAISNNENFNPVYRPFPGYDNLNERGEVIDPADNDGRPDKFVAPTNNILGTPDLNDFRERTFTATDVPSFRYYRIKLVMTSTNQVYVPRVKDLKVLALA